MLLSLVGCSSQKLKESDPNVSVTATSSEESKINDNNIVRQEKIDTKKYQLEYDKEQEKLEKERIAKEEAEKKNKRMLKQRSRKLLKIIRRITHQFQAVEVKIKRHRELQ